MQARGKRAIIVRFRPTQKRDFINNKINLLSISAEYRMIAVIVMRLTDATRLAAKTLKTGFPA
jgi:hypothetical protein